VYLDFGDAVKRLGAKVVEERYGNLFHMYEEITDDNPYETPMQIYPAPHYTMGGLWVDYNLMSTIPGLHVLGEANFSDHGANRLGASALMQGLADGYFVIPYTLGHYLASTKLDKVSIEHPAFNEAVAEVHDMTKKLRANKTGKRTIRQFWWDVGQIMWNHVGMGRNAEGLKKAIGEIAQLREQFWAEVYVPGDEDLNKTLELAGRVADYLELSELMAIDALHRNESCGGHFREEYQTPEGEALRNDAEYTYVAAWEYSGRPDSPNLHKEPLSFEYVKLAQRSYK
jgi:succinate dehydrogenase / fumarate reductase, flavoprotein subunit